MAGWVHRARFWLVAHKALLQQFSDSLSLSSSVSLSVSLLISLPLSLSLSFRPGQRKTNFAPLLRYSEWHQVALSRSHYACQVSPDLPFHITDKFRAYSSLYFTHPNSVDGLFWSELENSYLYTRTGLYYLGTDSNVKWMPTYPRTVWEFLLVFIF